MSSDFHLFVAPGKGGGGTSLTLSSQVASNVFNWRVRNGGAKFPVLKDIDKFVFADMPVDEGLVRELASGGFLDAKRNAIFIGGTGTGKTHLCIAVASAVIRARARGRFFNLVDLVNQLEQEKAAGRSGRLSEKLLRYDLIVIDELGYGLLTQASCKAVSMHRKNSRKSPAESRKTPVFWRLALETKE